MSYVYLLLAILFGVVCVFMMLLILIQKGRGGGLATAFGGGGGNTAFGTKTGDLLTWVTSVVFGIFLILTVGLTWTADAIHGRDTGVAQPVLPGDDALSPLDADGDGNVEPITPADPQSSMPDPPATPEPGIKPEADGSTNEGAPPKQ